MANPSPIRRLWWRVRCVVGLHRWCWYTADGKRPQHPAGEIARTCLDCRKYEPDGWGLTWKV